jgi:protein-tyrosine phosphatase
LSTTEPTENALSGLVNLRDLGGLPTDNGELTRSGVLYRSDAPRTGDRAPEDMPEWPPKVVVDLRDAVEQSTPEHPFADVATVHRISLLEHLNEEERNGDDPADGLSRLYQHMLDKASHKLVDVFRIALETDGPMLIHCAAGKDRTGVTAALLLRTVGVRTDSIVADYVRTDRNMYRVLQRLNVAPELPPGVDEEMVKELISTPVHAIEGVLARFDEHEDGAAGWLMAHGVSAAEVSRWQERFLRDTA